MVRVGGLYQPTKLPTVSSLAAQQQANQMYYGTHVTGLGNGLSQTPQNPQMNGLGTTPYMPGNVQGMKPPPDPFLYPPEPPSHIIRYSVFAAFIIFVVVIIVVYFVWNDSDSDPTSRGRFFDLFPGINSANPYYSLDNIKSIIAIVLFVIFWVLTLINLYYGYWRRAKINEERDDLGDFSYMELWFGFGPKYRFSLWNKYFLWFLPKSWHWEWNAERAKRYTRQHQIINANQKEQYDRIANPIVEIVAGG